MKLLFLLYVTFVCYSPVVGNLTPRLYGDIKLEWLLFYTLLIFFFVMQCIRKSLRLGGPLFFAVLLYCSIVLISVQWAPNYNYDLHTLTRIFARVISPMIILFIAMNIFSDKKASDYYIKHLLWAACFISLINIYQMLFGEACGDENFRASANFLNPNGVAMFLVLTLPCLLYAFEKRVLNKKLAFLFMAINAGGIISTVSRKGIFSMVLVYLLFYLFKKRFKKLIIVSVMILLVVIGLSGYRVVSHRFDLEEIRKQYIGKYEMTKAGLKMFLDSPVMGLGYRGYYENFARYFPHAVQKKYGAHNIYITALANYGIIGIIPFLAIFFIPLLASGKILFQKKRAIVSEYKKDMALICFFTLIPFMLCGFYAGGLFYNYKVLYIFYSNIALFLSIPSNLRNGHFSAEAKD